jgi:hypothetical protein
MKIWTDGCDFVFAKNESQIPAIMNARYRVVGHQERGQWRTVGDDEIVVLVAEGLGRALRLFAKQVSGLKREGWLGSTSWNAARTWEDTIFSDDCRTSPETYPGCLLPSAS